MRSPFSVDWNNRDAVCAYADQLAVAGGMFAVVQYPGRRNYNVVQAERLYQSLERDATVVHRTYEN